MQGLIVFYELSISNSFDSGKIGGITVAEHKLYEYCLEADCHQGFYTARKMRGHYKTSHSMDFGQAPLPKTPIELQGRR